MSELFRLFLESISVLVLALLFYSYTYNWFPPGDRKRRRRRTALNGVAFRALSVVLTAAGVGTAEGISLDLRDILVALVGLFEGWPAGLVAALIPAAYRLWLGGVGAGADAAATVTSGLAAGLVHAWARRSGGAGLRHAFSLSGLVFLANSAEFALLGSPGLKIFGRVCLPSLVSYVLGIGLLSRLFRDVVEQRRLMAEQQRFRAILDEATDAIRIVDADTLRILDVNRADCELSGHSREAMIGRDTREFWPAAPELRAKREAAVAEARQSGIARSYGLPYRTRSGKIVPVDSTRRIAEFQGRRYEIVLFHDATERLAAEAASREAAELRSATLLARAAAHEINNPLAALLGSLEMAAGRLPGDSQEARWVERAREAGERIRDFVARVNRITRIVETPPQEGISPILDTAKSSDPDPRA